MEDVHRSTLEQNDATVRAQVGPWTESGLADLGAFDAKTNFVVRAAAGSGKTTSLVARMVALVRQGVDVRSMAAITFTRKAAGEMNERLYRELQKARRALQEEGPAKEREAVERALRNLQHSFIGTIHAFCARLLREHSLAVSLPPDFRTGLEEREERELRERALSSYLQAVHEEAPERLSELREMGVDLDKLPVFFGRLCRFPDLTPYTDGPDEAPAMQEAVEKAAALLERWQGRRPDPLPKGRDKVMKAFDRAEAFRSHQQLDSPARQARFLEYFDGAIKKNDKAKVTLSAWGKRGSDEYEAARTLRDEELPDFVAHTIRPLLRQWSARVHCTLINLLEPAVEHYRAMRRARGDLTHHDLLYYTRMLLRDHPDVRAHIQDRYPRLLVDEFQDTDPLQAEIMFYLASSNPAEKDWRQCVPKPGSLFIVGDDKQSIYRFRGADKEVFDEVAGLVDRSGGEVVDLTRNFRSLEAICSWCNETFEALFCAPELKDVQANYVPFQASRLQGEGSHGLRRLDIDKVSRNRARDIARKDARQIARFIRGACEGAEGTLLQDEARSYADFLVLTRTKKRLHVYASELARHGVPYTVTGSEDLKNAKELRTLVDLLTCALRPDDAVACVAYLRGGCCGMSDDDLYRFRQAGGCFNRMHEPQQDEVIAQLPDELGDRFRAAFDRVCDVRRLLHSTRPSLAIEKIVSEAGLLAGAAHPDSRGEGSLRAGQVLRLLTHVRHLAGQGMEWGEIVEELQRVMDGEEAIDGMTLETGSGEAVRIMNLHQAKGLEAPVVFLTDPYSSRAGSHDPSVHVRREEGEVVMPVVEGESHYQTVTHAPLGWHDDSNRAFRAAEARHEAAQEHRLLYVAATRARDMLVVSTYPEKQKKGYWSDLYAHLDRADVPALPVPVPAEVEHPPAPAPALANARKRRSEQRAIAARPSYEETTVAEGKKTAAVLARKGYGKDFGTAVHALFELLVRHRMDCSALAGLPVERILSQPLEEVAREDVRRAREMARDLLTSDLWREVVSADEVYAEYPLTAVSDGSPRLVSRGVIDLLYATPEGWCIVDFKTDRLDGEAFSLPADHPYLGQVKQYACAWKRLSGAPVADAGLWFADAGVYEPVPVSG